MKSQQFNKFFLAKTEKNVEKILILGKKSPYDSYHTKFSKRESTKPLSIKILLIPFTEGMGEMSHKQQNLILYSISFAVSRNDHHVALQLD